MTNTRLDRRYRNWRNLPTLVAGSYAETAARGFGHVHFFVSTLPATTPVLYWRLSFLSSSYATSLNTSYGHHNAVKLFIPALIFFEMPPYSAWRHRGKNDQYCVHLSWKHGCLSSRHSSSTVAPRAFYSTKKSFGISIKLSISKVNLLLCSL